MILFRQIIKGTTALLMCFMVALGYSQQTFTNIAGSGADQSNIPYAKDGGCSFADYDLDGDLDLVVNTSDNNSSRRSYLLRNDNGVFTDVTNAVAPGLKSNERTERTATWGDCNNDGYPDLMVNWAFRLKIFINNAGASFTLYSNITSMTDGMNTEGAGWMDYDNDGDLDFFVENDEHGVDMFDNDGSTPNPIFTHITADAVGPVGAGAGGLGLPEGGSTDGDFATAVDLNIDGYVDIIARRRNNGTLDGQDNNPYDIFMNDGDGTFTPNTVFNERGDNADKGAVLAGDFDNDGDFDIIWTSGTTDAGRAVLYENTGTNSMNFVLVPNPFKLDSGAADTSTDSEGAAMADVDHDGDLDVFFTRVGGGPGILYLNNSTGAGVFDFRQPGPTWIAGASLNYGINIAANGQGCVFADIDNDGDADLYVNRNGSANQLWRNDYIGSAAETAAIYQNNYLRVIPLVDVGSGITRPAVNATVTFLDCDGNPIGGVREIGSGGAGHGSQTTPWLIFGLPNGPDASYNLEVQFTRNGSAPVRVQRAIIPSGLAPLFLGSSTMAMEQTIIIKDSDLDVIDPCIDTDGDGISNAEDIDVDNDGIPDVEEMDCSTFIPINSGGYTIGTDYSGSSPLAGMVSYAGVDLDIHYQLQGSTIWSSGVQIQNQAGLLPDGDYVNLQPRNTDFVAGDQGIYSLDFSSPVRDLEFKWGGLDVHDASKFEAYFNGNSIPVDNSNIENINIPAADFSYLGPDIIRSTSAGANAPNNAVRFNMDQALDSIVIRVGKYNGNSGNITLQLFEVSYCLDMDSDGDGVADHFDLDSDNDGIYDLVEAGHGAADLNADGVIDGMPADFGSNGLFDGVEDVPDSGMLDQPTADSDGDGNIDSIELDSDNDGCNDVIEAGFSDPDGNGLLGTGN